jgi:hypothetical protein
LLGFLHIEKREINFLNFYDSSREKRTIEFGGILSAKMKSSSLIQEEKNENPSLPMNGFESLKEIVDAGKKQSQTRGKKRKRLVSNCKSQVESRPLNKTPKLKQSGDIKTPSILSYFTSSKKNEQTNPHVSLKKKMNRDFQISQLFKCL